ncbi:MAG TPA: hypothetical protein VJV79_33690 [Polyangiaceae bacterium]|nr:hypothetical protein [Polyangiaceae bacterium]
MPARQPRTGAYEPKTRGDIAKGVEAYPYDPTLRLESQRGLDRLRCFPDRALAADFFAVFQAAERNTEVAVSAEQERAQKRDAELRSLRALATRAFNGELGLERQELAAHILLDEHSTRANDERSLRNFAFALQELKRIVR